MTLNTRIAVLTPGLDFKEAFEHLIRLVGGTDEHLSLIVEVPTGLSMPPGVGLKAWCHLHRSEDGGLLPLDEDETHDRESDDPDKFYSPEAYADLTFDTGYAYSAPNGAGCGDLHAWVVQEMGAWLTERGHTYDWHDEGTGEWGPEGWGSLGDPDFGDPDSVIPVPTTDERAEMLDHIRKLIGF